MGTPNVLFIFSSPSTQWVPLTGTTASTGFCTPNIALLSNGGGDVVLSGTANGTPFNYKGTNYTTYPAAGASLTVQKSKKPKFAFNVCDASGATNTYFLGGVGLKNMASSGGSGGTSFPSASVSTAADGSTTLQLQDDNMGSSNSTAQFDFWVLVQNSSGDVGLIDPLINNEN